jgi:phosphoribosylamine---glycine ligase
MNILVLGSGGREHAFAWKISQSSRCDNLYIAPGNAGTALHGTNVPVSVTDFEAIEKLVLEKSVGMVVVGPEDPLVKGIHDYFLSKDTLRKIPVIGPCKMGAQLEGSKSFSKEFMQRHHIPTARYKTFYRGQSEEASAFLATLKAPYVLKADGLAAGKGVLIPDNLEEARREVFLMLEEAKFGEASSKVVIEEFLEGIELSVFVLTDGRSYKILPAAKDYKRIGEGDTGLNTGGMGAVSPVPFADAAFMNRVEEKIVRPTVEGLRKDDIPYKGFIFIGLMNCGGEPYVIEYNVRMGDPETEVVIPRLKSDLVELFEGVAEGTLEQKAVETEKSIAVTVMAVSGGYPGEYAKGKEIKGLSDCKQSLVFHAGTSQDAGAVRTAGGRVLAFTSYGETLQEALSKSYSSIAKVSYEGMYFRRDIGRDLLRLAEEKGITG